MKRGLFYFIALIVLCLAVLFAGVSSPGKVCSTKDKSFICSVFNLVFYVNANSTAIAPDENCTRFYIHSDLPYYQELTSSIFHPPKIVS